MFSGAGDAAARRRRDLSNPFNLCHLFLSFLFISVSFLRINLPKNPVLPLLVVFFSDEQICNGGTFQRLTSLELIQISSAILSLNPATPMSRQISDAHPQISEQYFIDLSSGSKPGVEQDPPTSPPHRISLMARASLGPSVALLSVGTSTAHDESQSWQLVPSSPTIISVLHGGGDPDLTLPTPTNLGFGWMGLSGPVILIRPKYKICREAQTPSISQALFNFVDPSPLRLKSRSDLLNALVTLALKICCLLENGRRRYSISATRFLDETCYYKSQNRKGRVAWLSPDARLILKLIGLEFISNHRWCELDHASVLFCDYTSSIKPSSMKLNHPRSCLSILLLPIRHCLGSLVDLDARRLHLRLRLPRMFGIYIGCARILVNAPFVILFATSYHWKKQVCLNPLLVPSAPTCQLLPQGLGSDLNSQGQPDYKLCVEFLNLHGQWLHVREDPPALLRLVTLQMRFPVLSSPKATSPLQPSKPLVSSVEHTFKSSNAYIVRAKYDHLLVRDFQKLVFKLESYKTSKDLPSLASSSRLCIFLEDSCSLYLYFSCNPLLLSCKNIPSFEVLI